MNLTNFESMGKISSFVFHTNDRNFSKLQDFHSGVKELNVSCSHFRFLYCWMSNNVESSMRSQTFFFFFFQSKSTVLDICLRSFRGSLKQSMTCGSCLIVVVSWLLWLGSVGERYVMVFTSQQRGEPAERVGSLSSRLWLLCKVIH